MAGVTLLAISGQTIPTLERGSGGKKGLESMEHLSRKAVGNKCEDGPPLIMLMGICLEKGESGCRITDNN